MGKKQLTTVTVTCRDCGERKLSPRGVGVKVWSDGRMAFAYFCDRCYLPHQYSTTDDMVEALVNAGAHLETIEVPVEYEEITKLSTREPIRVEDILTFLDGLTETYDRKDWPEP